MRIALNQFAASLDAESNLRQICADIERAAELGVHLLVLPEAAISPFGGQLHPSLELPVLRDCARHHGVTVVYGAFRPAHDGRLHNTLVAISPNDVVTYDKIHTFEGFGYKESASIMPGTKPAVFRMTVGGESHLIGLSTCYDIRFPELYVKLGQMGVSAIICAASWADGPGKARQWDALTQARALDATSFIIAVDQARPEVPRKGPTGIGRSAVIAPDGEVLVRMDEKPGLVPVEVDLNYVATVREQLPVLLSRPLM
ncbi:MAG: nitrilase-related carbon-nitrogen hydrolase [Corynebacterium sp.]|nr:nitrilase-related carbon-nitrogen hydrolase [Corynebacterium sp.]